MSFNMSHTRAVERIGEIERELTALASKASLTRAEDDKFKQLAAEADQVNAHRLNLERGADLAAGRSVWRAHADGSGGYRTPGSGVAYVPGSERAAQGDYDAADDRPQRRNDGAMRTLDRHVASGALPARSAETVERLTRSGSPQDQDWTSRVVQATGSDAYMRAFSRLVADPARGHLLWTAEEAEAFRTVEGLRSETRAMSLTDSAGGYMVPLTLDPSIIISNAGSINPLRQISRVVQTTTESWSGITSAGVSAEWKAEAAQAADATPTLANPTIPVHMADAFVAFSYEVSQDAVNFAGELAKVLLDAYDQLTATAFTTGSGSGQPTGIITALVGGSSAVAPTTAETFAPATDVYKLQNALSPRWQPNASWTANLTILNACRQAETTNGALKFPELAGDPPKLLGRNVYENSNMDGSINAAASENNYVLLYGDFSQFVIVDRFPTTIEPIANLVGANGRPTAQRGAFLWARTGSDSVVDDAFRMLSIPTTA